MFFAMGNSVNIHEELIDHKCKREESHKTIGTESILSGVSSNRYKRAMSIGINCLNTKESTQVDKFPLSLSNEEPLIKALSAYKKKYRSHESYTKYQFPDRYKEHPKQDLSQALYNRGDANRSLPP